MNLTEMFSFNPEFLAGLVPFALYALTALVLSVVFIVVYNKVTPYCEWDLMKQDKNIAAAWAFGGAFIGFSIPLAEAIRGSHNIIDFTLWGVVAMVVQITVFFLLQKPMPKLVQRIKENEQQAGLFLALLSIGAGILNAACMSN